MATKQMAATATLHCLIGCAIGELIGVTIGTHTGIGREATVLLATVLSFVSGYTFSVIPIIRTGMKFLPSLKLIFAADTVSILTMTVVDNACMLLIPGAFDKDLTHPVYWLSRLIAMIVAFLAAWPVNYYLLKKGKGHALHGHHDHAHIKFYAIRHGQTDFNIKGVLNGHIDDQLTEVGREQATEAAMQLPETLKRMYASPLQRARETAELLNQHRKLPIIYSDDLKEVNFGELNGTPYTEEIKLRHEAMDYNWRPSGENVDDVKKRVLHILHTIAAENNDGEALVVTHGGIIRMFHYLEDGKPFGTVDNVSIHEFDINYEEPGLSLF